MTFGEVSTEAIAIWSIVASALVAIAAIIGTGLSAWRDRVHQRTMAQQQRRAEAYAELLDVVWHVGNWAQGLAPWSAFAGMPAGIADPPALERQTRATGLVMTFGSQPVVIAHGAWADAVTAVQKTAGVLQSGMADSRADDWKQLDRQLKPQEVRLRQSLINAIRVDLGVEQVDLRRRPSMGPEPDSATE